jgi:hypothetical protein
VSWIANEEHVLEATLVIPTSLAEAEQVQNEHRGLQLTIDVGIMK